MNNELSKLILATLAYYDVMDYPMTGFEVWKYLTRVSNYKLLTPDEEKYSLGDVIKELEEDKLKRFVEEYRGYYFLRGSPPATLRSPDALAQTMRAGVAMRAGQNLVEQRIERNKIAGQKFRIVRQVAWWLRFAPFVRGVAVAGRLAMKNAEMKSDLDLFIVIQHGKIFTGRLLITLLVHILGKRRHGRKVQDRICLNHFVTDTFSISVKDIFSAHEYSFLAPIFNGDAFLGFYENNGWIRNYKINLEIASDNLQMIPDSGFSRFVRKASEKFLQADFVESYLRKWQKKRINKNPKTGQIGGVILADDSELAFWPNFENQGPKVFEKFQERLVESR